MTRMQDYEYGVEGLFRSCCRHVAAEKRAGAAHPE